MTRKMMLMNQSTDIETLEEWVQNMLDDNWEIEHQSLSSAYDPNEGDNGAVVLTIMLTVWREE